MSYIYIHSKPDAWTVGFYSPDGTWNPESQHRSSENAANRVHWLNGYGEPLEDLSKRVTERLDRYEKTLERLTYRIAYFETHYIERDGKLKPHES